jgi:hypothetical protein
MGSENEKLNTAFRESKEYKIMVGGTVSAV